MPLIGYKGIVGLLACLGGVTSVEGLLEEVSMYLFTIVLIYPVGFTGVIFNPPDLDLCNFASLLAFPSTLILL